MSKLRISLNGTDTNPFERYGLTQNPYPQSGRYEHNAADLALQKLGGLPIPNKEYIREVLQGKVSEELIELCVTEFKKGEYVRFEINYEEKRAS